MDTCDCDSSKISSIIAAVGIWDDRRETKGKNSNHMFMMETNPKFQAVYWDKLLLAESDLDRWIGKKN